MELQAMVKITNTKEMEKEVKEFLFREINLCLKEGSKEIHHIMLTILERKYRKILSTSQLAN